MDEHVNKVKYGTIGEDIAACFLRERGYKIIERNVRIGRFGEIDIIASQGEYICFIEVKTRKDTSFGMPSEAVGIKKQNKLRLLAEMYINRKGLRNKSIRFDVVEIITENKYDKIIARTVNLIQNAF